MFCTRQGSLTESRETQPHGTQKKWKLLSPCKQETPRIDYTLLTFPRQGPSMWPHVWISGVWIQEREKCPPECSHSFLRDLQGPSEEVYLLVSPPHRQSQERSHDLLHSHRVQAAGDLNALSCPLSLSPFKWQLGGSMAQWVRLES